LAALPLGRGLSAAVREKVWWAPEPVRARRL